MTAVRWASFHFGDNAELLAEFILNTIAFTSRVPRQEDVGHDLLCALAELDGKLLKAGPSFTVQIKSNKDPIPFGEKGKRYEVEWLKHQENPFFICVANRKDLCVDLYSTWNVHNSIHWREAARIILRPDDDDAEFELPFPREEPECREQQTVPLGRPILRIFAHDAMNKEKAQHYSNVLKSWILLERKNIVAAEAGFHWIQGPVTYQTNESIADKELIKTVYYNIQRHSEYRSNLIRAALNLRLAYRHSLGEVGEQNPAIAGEIQLLEGVIEFYWDILDPLAHQAYSNLKDRINEDSSAS
jgi:hypothetical protein